MEIVICKMHGIIIIGTDNNTIINQEMIDIRCIPSRTGRWVGGVSFGVISTYTQNQYSPNDLRHDK